MDPTPLTVRDVARRLGLGESRVRALDAVLLPARTVSGVRLYTAESVDRYLARRHCAARDREARP